MVIRHKKNTAYYMAIPMIDSESPASFKDGLTVADTAYYKDGDGAWTSLPVTDTFAEIGATGIYEIDLTAAELNHDLVIIKLTSAGAADSLVIFEMDTIEIDDIPTTAMRGTDGANTTVPDAAGVAAGLHGTTDGKIDTAQADLDKITGSAGAVLDATAVDAVLDEVVEGSITLRQAVRLFLSVLTCKVSGGRTTTIAFRDIADTKDRLVVTVDAEGKGNRTEIVTRDGT